MRGTFTLCVILLAACSPSASADDPLRDENCDLGPTCVGPGTCLPVTCVPRSCQPAFHCRSEVDLSSECARNVTIQGETCQAVVGFGGRTNAPENDLGVRVGLSNGHVDAFNLPNTWVSPSVEAGGSLGAADLGDVSAGIYTTNIQTDGDQDHEWRHIAVTLYHGPSLLGSGESARAGVYVLDATLEGCYVRESSLASVSADCPRLVPGDLLGPILP